MPPNLPHPRYYEGIIDPTTCARSNLVYSSEFGTAELQAEMHVFITDAVGVSLLRDALQNGENKLETTARSGISRSAIELRQLPNTELAVEEDLVSMQVGIIPLWQRDKVFNVLFDVARGTNPKIHLGGIVLSATEAFLNPREVQQAVEEHELWVPDSAIFNTDDGSVDLLLDDLHYISSPNNFTDERIRRILREGKHALSGLQTPSREPRPAYIQPKEFYVGSTRLSVGPYMAIIDPIAIVDGKPNDDLIHLAARVMHGVRTTGKDVPRQLELYNKGDSPIATDKIRVRIRFAHADPQTKDVARKVINKRTLERGVSFDDLADFQHNGASFFALMKMLSSHMRPDHAYGMLVGGGRAAYLQWQYDQTLQDSNTTDVVTPAFMAEENTLQEDAIPPPARELANSILRNVGGEQSLGKLMATYAFPPPRIMHQLLHQGVGIFMAHDLKRRSDAYAPNKDSHGKQNELVFGGSRYEEFRSLEDGGAQLYVVMHDEVDELDNDKVVPAHVRKFHRGLFTRPHDIERMEKLDTIGAFFGGNAFCELGPDLDKFMGKMKSLLGERFGVTHGRGPGVMLDADRAAEKHGVFRIGVGIDARLKRQKMNPRPEAMVIFDDNDRLPRQRLMDDLSTFKIFNIGGAGTFEEAAITICSQKLSKNIPAPLIFIDPLCFTQDESHLWSQLKGQIETLSHEYSLPGDGDEVKRVRLLADYIPKTVHLVRSYDDAFEILRKYIADPLAYFREIGIPAKDLQLAFLSAEKNFEATGFPWPEFVPKNAPDILAKEEATRSS